MRRRDHCVLTYTVLFLVFFSGCTKPIEKKTIPVSEAQAKFLKLCSAELHLTVETKQFQDSFWVYVPLNERIFDLKATEKNPPEATEAKEKQNIYFLDVKFKDKNFTVDYDIGLNKSYPTDLGYGYTYPEKFRATQQNILSAIQRSFAEAQKAPEFFVVIFADIEKGIEMRNIVYLQDLLRVFVDQGFQEEFLRRSVSIAPHGGKDIIDDKQGNHVDYHDVTWTEFIAEQIKYRTQFKYSKSAFAPSDNAVSELTTQIKETLKSYDFHDFSGVILHNLASETQTTLSSSELK